MSRSKQIRQWLAENPGWHFMGDIVDGIGVEQAERLHVAQSVSRMAKVGHVIETGNRGTKRYTFGRQARLYTRLEASND